MSVLRVRPRLSDGPLECDWTLIEGSVEVDRGEGPLRDAPGHAARAELVIPASDWLITCVQLPPSARRRAGATLAYAVEEETLGDPESQHVTWLGNRGDADVLGVVDRAGFRRWLEALEKAYGSSAAYGETLLLPRRDAEWSLAWDGVEGFVRTGELEGAATDSGDRHTPPLALQLMLDHAAARDALPSAVAVYGTAPDAAPDLEAWQEKLGVRVYVADGDGWDWRTASPSDRARITHGEAGARALSRVAKRLRPAAWIAAAALAVHALALVADWSWRQYEQRVLRQQMETRFRAAFPDAVSVVDPVLQMRRKLADLRHAAHQADPSDFVPLMGHVGAAAKELPAGALRLVTYERGRLTLQFGAIDEASAQRIAGRLRDAGLRVDVASPPASSKSGERTVVVTESGQIGSDLAVLRAQAAMLERQAVEIERLRALPAPAPAPKPLELRALVDSAMRAAGLAQGLRVDARGADEAQVVLGGAPFAAWLASVASLQAQQVRLETGRIEALPGPGMVSVTATFVRSARP